MKRALGMLVLIVLGCSVLVEPQAEPRCTREGGCPDGLSCVIPADGEFGRCMDACTMPVDEECNGRDDDCDGTADEGLDMIAEICNGVDEDCDNRIDEGNAIDGVGGPGVDTLEEGFDQDGDTYNICGTQDCVDPDVACEVDNSRADCNDTDSEIHPDAGEICNGIDNNCDGEAFPPGDPDGSCVAPRDVLCGEGTICEPSVGCVAPDCRSGRPCLACDEDEACQDDGSAFTCEILPCDPTSCASDEYCPSFDPEFPDRDLTVCAPREANGSDCTRDDECLSNACLPGIQVGLPGNVCFEACCRDAECGAGEFCWGPGTGARTCVRPRTGLNATTGRSAVGAGGPGASCSSGGDCRSGLCEGSTCFGSCGLSSDCPDACGLTSNGLGCRSGGEILDSCTADSQCALDVCTGSAVDDVCVFSACTEVAACPSADGFDRVCDYVAINGTAVSVCGFDEPSRAGGFPIPEPRNGAYGEECQTGFCTIWEECCGGVLCSDQVRTGCDSRTCVNNRCTQACCSDASCPGADVCRPTRITIEGATFYPMFCVPPS